MSTIAMLQLGRSFAGRSFGVNVGSPLAGWHAGPLVLDIEPDSSGLRAHDRTLLLAAGGNAREPHPGTFDLWQALQQDESVPADPVLLERGLWLASACVSAEMQRELSALEGAGTARMSELVVSFARLLKRLAEGIGATRVFLNCEGDPGPLTRLVVASSDSFCLVTPSDARAAALVPALSVMLEGAVDLRKQARARERVALLGDPGPKYLGYVLTSALEPHHGGVPSWQLDVELRELLKAHVRDTLKRLDPNLLVPYASEIGDLRGPDELAASAYAAGRLVGRFPDRGYTRGGCSAWELYRRIAFEISRRIAPTKVVRSTDSESDSSRVITGRDRGAETEECSLCFPEPFVRGLLVEWVTGKEQVYALARGPSGEYFPVRFFALNHSGLAAGGWLDVPSGRKLNVVIEPHLILVEELSIECMTFAVRYAWRDGYFSRMRPLAGDEIPARTWEWPLSARGDDPVL